MTEQVLELRNTGMSAKQIAREMGVKTRIVRGELKRMGLIAAGRPQKGICIRRVKWPQIALMYWQGHLPATIARRLGAHHTSVLYAVKQIRKFVDITPYESPGRHEKWPLIAFLYWRGHSYATIGRMVGRNHSSVMNAVEKIKMHIDISPDNIVISPKICKPVAVPRVIKRRVPKEDFAQTKNARVERMMQLATSIAKRRWKERSIAA